MNINIRLCFQPKNYLKIVERREVLTLLYSSEFSKQEIHVNAIKHITTQVTQVEGNGYYLYMLKSLDHALFLVRGHLFYLIFKKRQ